MRAYVLMHVQTGSVVEVLRNVRRVPGVKEASMTFGPYDVVAIVHAEDINHLGHMIAAEIQPIPGILDTLTCLVVEP